MHQSIGDMKDIMNEVIVNSRVLKGQYDGFPCYIVSNYIIIQ